MISNLHLYLTTAGRPNRQITWRNLPEELQARTTLVVQAREQHLYDHPLKMILPDEIRSLSPTRQYVLDHAEHRYISLLDDDLIWCKRMPDGTLPANQAMQHSTALEIFAEQERWLTGMCECGHHFSEHDDGCKYTVDCTDRHTPVYCGCDRQPSQFAHAGISAREGNNREPADYRYCTRMMRVLSFDRELVNALGVRFDRVPCMGDFDFVLQLIRHGYPNRVSFRFAQGQYGKSNADGGCSTYRTPEMLDASARRLAEMHPGFVVLREKPSTNWEGFPQTRTDVTIYWKRALNTYEEGTQ